jgi:hypothetical protein
MAQPESDIVERLYDALVDGASGSLSDIVRMEDARGQMPLDGVWLERFDVILRGEADVPVWWGATDARTTLDAVRGLLASSIVEAVCDEHVSTLAAFPVPDCSRQRAEQLALLFRARERSEVESRVVGSLDRCVADLYGLSLSMLLEFERHLSEAQPR